MSTPAGNSNNAKMLSEMNEEQLLDMIKRAKDDPFLVPQLLTLQKQAYESTETLIQKISHELSAVEAKSNSMPLQVTNVAALASAARSRASWGKQKRELAQQVAFGAFMNRNNPDWNPMDASTSQPTESGILALLKFDPNNLAGKS